jgi:hypothetical protein
MLLKSVKAGFLFPEASNRTEEINFFENSVVGFRVEMEWLEKNEADVNLSSYISWNFR